MSLLSLLRKIVNEPEKISELSYTRRGGRVHIFLKLRDGTELRIEASPDRVVVNGVNVQISLDEIESELKRLIRSLLARISERLERIEKMMKIELEKTLRLLR